jgi:probable HAF family extracellular repeat protein
MGRTMRRTWRGTVAITGVAWLTLSAHAQTSGFWLVGLPPGGKDNDVRVLSQDGLVAGGASWIPATQTGASFRWTAVGGRDDWGLLPGMPQRNSVYGCDSTGLIVAGDTWFDNADRAFRRVGDGPLENLGVLPGETRSYANGMSGDGTIVVGYCENGPFTYKFTQAFRWTAASGMQPLGKLTPFSPLCDARAISRDGTTIVGLNINEVGWFQAFVWTEATGVKALPTLTGAPSGASAYAVNADGSVVVGASPSVNGKSHASRWMNGQIQDLTSGILVAFHSTAFSASDDGGVVGGSYQPGGGKSLAIVWTSAAGIIKTEDYLAQHGITVPAQYDLEYIYAISGDGRTLGGSARNLATNQEEGWVASIPAPSTCAPDCDESGQLNIDDFVCFQTFFALGDTKADCDGSGSLNIDDFICFQTSFVLGC